MIIKIAEYKTKERKSESVLAAIGKFVAAIKTNEPGTLYEAFRRGDSSEFVHLMKFPDDASEKKHASASYTSEFVKALYPNCENEPKFTDLIPIE